jgi:hypothetical protein
MGVTQAVPSGQEARLMRFLAHGTFCDFSRDLSFTHVHGQPGKFDLVNSLVQIHTGSYHW